jgi:hypothetical protein
MKRQLMPQFGSRQMVERQFGEIVSAVDAIIGRSMLMYRGFNEFIIQLKRRYFWQTNPGVVDADRAASRPDSSWKLFAPCAVASFNNRRRAQS